MRRLALLAFAALAISTSAAAAPLNLDRAGQALVDRINRDVNGRFPALAPYDDPDGDGVWDCENYAAEKLARLRNAGVDADALELQRVDTAEGQSHAVLLVHARRGGRAVDLVLDNLSQWTVPRADLPYTRWGPLAVAPGAAVTAVTGRLR